MKSAGVVITNNLDEPLSLDDFQRLMSGSVEGSFSHTFEHGSPGWPPPLFTLTFSWRAKWWRRPFLWLLGRPTSFEEVFTDVRFCDMVEDEFGVTFSFQTQSHDPASPAR